VRESDIQNAIRLACARLATLFRNNVGLGWAGEVADRWGSSLHIRNARPLHAGLCKGSSDLIGWTPITVTQEMVGRKVAVFTAIECKNARGQISREQRNFLKRLKEDGGIGVVARSAEEASGGIAEWSTRKQ
jgi:hypothetical protein